MGFILTGIIGYLIGKKKKIGGEWGAIIGALLGVLGILIVVLTTDIEK